MDSNSARTIRIRANSYFFSNTHYFRCEGTLKVKVPHLSETSSFLCYLQASDSPSSDSVPGLRVDPSLCSDLRVTFKEEEFPARFRDHRNIFVPDEVGGDHYNILQDDTGRRVSICVSTSLRNGLTTVKLGV